MDKECFETAPDRTDQCTIIEITMFAGRTFATKKGLYQAIVNNLADSPGIAGHDILIMVYELPLENWGIRGGKPASELDLGFNVNV
ncbi:MAG: tautomerase family protein [Chitinophagales bacterium]